MLNNILVCLVLDDLHHIDQELELCEKALAQYLESKKVDFPRFYFVATADLLEILSNGNSPHLILRLCRGTYTIS